MTIRLRRGRRRRESTHSLQTGLHRAMIASHHRARRSQCLALIRRQRGIEGGEGRTLGVQIGDTLLEHFFLAAHARHWIGAIPILRGPRRTIGGLALGCWNAWHWVIRESRDIQQHGSAGDD